MRIDGRQFALKMAGSAADLAQRQLRFHALSDGMFIEQVMDRLLMGKKRQAVGEFEAAMGLEGVISANPARADGGLVNRLHRQRWLKAIS